jgi:hypothetical protein
MKRRAFISMMAGAAGALVLPVWRKPERLIVLVPPRLAMSTNYIAHGGNIPSLAQLQPMDYGIGMAQAKREGAPILYDLHSYDEWSYTGPPGANIRVWGYA